ncbi:DNA-directed RNA polymerase subunit D [Candidatus Pacearchaeota archaeon]|nr:DNA-directed RNA polymerase subunit D [Candidatus Pacearchaeota archaeon]
MKTIKKTDEKVIFQAEVEEGLANAIRRYLSQVLVMAVDEVEIAKNDSALYDETVAHRIGLLPIKTSKAAGEKTTADIKLIVKKEGLVYAKEFDGKVNVVYGDAPITFLEKGQEIELVAKARTGKGDEHSKFSPGLMFYRNVFDIKIGGDCPKEVVEVCPKNILKSKDGKIVTVDTSKCDMCEACMEVCEKQGKDSIKITPTKELTITVESFGQLSTEDMISKSVDALRKDLADVSKGM